MRWPTVAIRFETAVFAVAAYIVLCLNGPFWSRLSTAVQADTLYDRAFLLVVGLLLWLLTTLAFGAFAFPYVFKPVAVLAIFVSAGASYFMREYGTVIDLGMITNVLQTDRAEAADLMTLRFVRSMLLWALVPSVLVCLAEWRLRPPHQEILFRLTSGLAIVAIGSALAFAFMQNIVSVFREHSILKHEITPFNVVVGMRRALAGNAVALRPRLIKPFGEDARLAALPNGRDGKRITVLVVGETARSMNFSLNGYGRNTNPQLAAIPGVVSFFDVASCGTATAQSLPCMFAGVGQAATRVNIAMEQEGLLDVIKRAGLSLLWRDNQSGCKGICFRVPYETVMTAEPIKFYELAISYDEKLLVGLQDWINTVSDHGVVVLHMMGSHGPAYSKRYPPTFETFKPACHDAQFSRCSREEILNAYDNTLVYTDHVLSRLITLLHDNDQRGTATAMMYLSDHGESLGERGVYLHGLPYALAPAEQKQVPWIWWLSPRYQQASAVTNACLRKQAQSKLSHDHFFHSVLGLLGIATRVYDRKLDITALCRNDTSD